MATWTDPITWVTDDIVSAAQANQYWRDGLNLAAHREATAGTTVDVANSSTETTLFTFSVPANRMSTDRMLRLTLVGDYLWNNNTADTCTLRTKFGAQTDALAIGGTTISGTRGQWQLTVLVCETNAVTNSQYISTKLELDGALNTGGNTEVRIWDSTPSIDTTAGVTFTISAQWSAISVNDSWRMRYACLEIVGS